MGPAAICTPIRSWPTSETTVSASGPLADQAVDLHLWQLDPLLPLVLSLLVSVGGLALLIGLEGRHLDDDPAAGVGRLPDAHREHGPRDSEVLDGAGQGE